MSQIFPKWANRLPLYIILSVALLLVAVISFFWYYGSPKYTDVGYRPVQPIPYSHKLHAGDLGIDCRYCHSQVEYSRHANLPSVAVCMNCHTLIGADKATLQPLRENWENVIPLKWTRIHKLPDYVYFDHSAHLAAGVSCIVVTGMLLRWKR